MRRNQDARRDAVHNPPPPAPHGLRRRAVSLETLELHDHHRVLDEASEGKVETGIRYEAALLLASLAKGMPEKKTAEADSNVDVNADGNADCKTNDTADGRVNLDANKVQTCSVAIISSTSEDPATVDSPRPERSPDPKVISPPISSRVYLEDSCPIKPALSSTKHKELGGLAPLVIKAPPSHPLDGEDATPATKKRNGYPHPPYYNGFFPNYPYYPSIDMRGAPPPVSHPSNRRSSPLHPRLHNASSSPAPKHTGHHIPYYPPDLDYRYRHTPSPHHLPIRTHNNSSHLLPPRGLTYSSPESSPRTYREGAPASSSTTASPFSSCSHSPRRSNEHGLTVITKRKWAWKDYPELETFLIANRDDYLRHSAMCYTAQQKEYNNHLTERLLDVAARHGYIFDERDFNFVAIRDRIRCYYKSYVQSSKKRGIVVGYPPIRPKKRPKSKAEEKTQDICIGKAK